MTESKKPFENIVGKAENAGNQNFLLYSQYLLPYRRPIIILAAFNLSFAYALNFDQSKELLSGEELCITDFTNV